MASGRLFTKIANKVASAAGHPVTFIGCVAIVVIWAVSGPIFGFSDTWQLIINTGTTIVTFLMVFLIQNTQNRDGAAIQAKLDEIIRAGSAENVFIGIEHLTEDEVNEFRKKCEHAATVNKARKGFYHEKVLEKKVTKAIAAEEAAEAKVEKKRAVAKRPRKAAEKPAQAKAAPHKRQPEKVK